MYVLWHMDQTLKLKQAILLGWVVMYPTFFSCFFLDTRL